MKVYKDGKVVKDPQSSGKLAPVLADMTLGKLKSIHGEYAGAKQFLDETNDGSGDAVDKIQRAHSVTEYSLGKLAQGSNLVDKMNLADKATNVKSKGAKKALEGIAKVAPKASKAASGALKTLNKIPIGETLSAVQSVKSLTDGSMSSATDDERTATGLAGAGAAVSAGATLAGAGGTVGAATGAAAAASAGGAGIMGTVGAGLAALGPVGWATLALGAGAAALGVFGNKTFRKRGRW